MCLQVRQFRARQMALKGPRCALRFVLRIEMKHDWRHLAPVGTLLTHLHRASGDRRMALMPTVRPNWICIGGYFGVCCRVALDLRAA